MFFSTGLLFLQALHNSDQTFDMADMFLDMADMTDIFLDMLLPKSKFLKGVGRASANIFSSENALGVCAV